MIEYTSCDASHDKADATVVHELCYSRPRTGFYFVEDLYDVIDEPVIHWNRDQAALTDDHGTVIAHVQLVEPLILSLVKVAPDLQLVVGNQVVAVIERNMGREVTISLPGYDLTDALVLKRLGKAKRRLKGWQLLTRVKDPDHWVRMISPVFGDCDRGVVTVEGTAMARITANMMVLDDALQDERQRATVLALAVNTWVK